MGPTDFVQFVHGSYRQFVHGPSKCYVFSVFLNFEIHCDLKNEKKNGYVVAVPAVVMIYFVKKMLIIKETYFLWSFSYFAFYRFKLLSACHELKHKQNIDTSFLLSTIRFIKKYEYSTFQIYIYIYVYLFMSFTRFSFFSAL